MKIEVSSTIEVGSELYITYIGCITPINQRNSSFLALSIVLVYVLPHMVLRMLWDLIVLPSIIHLPEHHLTKDASVRTGNVCDESVMQSGGLRTPATDSSIETICEPVLLRANMDSARQSTTGRT